MRARQVMLPYGLNQKKRAVAKRLIENGCGKGDATTTTKLALRCTRPEIDQELQKLEPGTSCLKKGLSLFILNVKTSIIEQRKDKRSME
ncbi:hypothetical protein A4A49_06908 [Nicotiana attenuata]|uniref:Uncharacterized protein n=1 Tax=Nicotiana attenuata TaxID=49451 RepID=A0A1J6I6P7_NICAT|nr:hypothetical protein A4A49_06908 [Nicotiana attenuata]